MRGGCFGYENAFIAADGEHEPYFHSSVAGGFEGGLYAWGGDEIGGLEVDIVLRMVEHVADEGFHTHDFVCGVDGQDMDGRVVQQSLVLLILVIKGAAWRPHLFVVWRQWQNAFAFCPIPKEDGLKLFDGGGVGEAKVGVAPSAAVDTLAVALGDVHAAKVCRSAVYGDYLAVVSEVDGNTIAGE